MERRNFIKTGSLASLIINSLLSGSCNNSPYKIKKVQKVNPDQDDFELNEATVAGLQKLMQEKKHTSHSITALYLKRIDAFDKQGPTLNAIIELNPDALKIADQMDKERSSGNVRGLLHGIPVLIKDNIDTADRMLTTAGSIALQDNHATKDAFIVDLLRKSGAVILGKTNLSEWANFRSTHSTSAWSSRGGQTKNPYILDRNPSGSSAGSGSAVAANLCAIAIGTETDGSVVSPSSVNGLVGIKPTVGLLSRSGIIPISRTQDTAGPMARTVQDAVILLSALTDVDPTDAFMLSNQRKAVKDYTKFLDKDGLKGKRLGLEKSALKSNAGTQILLQDALKVMKSQGAEIIEIELNKELDKTGDAEFEVLLFEFKAGLNDYLKKANSKIKTLEDLIAYNAQNATKAMPFFKQETLELSQKKGDLKTKTYLKALKDSSSFTKTTIDALMKKERLDAIIGPTNGFAVCIDLVNGDYDNGFSFSSPAARAGYPHITVPMGSWHELPMGISFFGMAYTEPELIKVAYAYEQASNKRTPPKFLSTLLS